MKNFNIKLNLMKLSRTGIMQIQGRGEVLRCLVIPVEENHIFVSADEQTNRPKAAYLDMSAWVIQNPKYDETHLIKQSLPKEVRDQMDEQEKKAQPIIGGMKPINIEIRNNASSCEAPFVQVGDLDDLPF